MTVNQNPAPVLWTPPDEFLTRTISHTSAINANTAPRTAKISPNITHWRFEDRNAAVTAVTNAPPAAIRLNIGRIRVIIEPDLTWARTWALSLKSQKIRTSYEARWLERELTNCVWNVGL